jgi:putative transposase
VATMGGITAEDVQDLMVATVEHRYGQVNRVPEPIEWLTDNPVLSEAEGGSCTPLATHVRLPGALG